MNSASATIRDFVIVDVETTGLNSSRDSIIEVAALKVENLKVTGDFSSLVRPTVRIPFKVSKLTGISQKMVDKYGQSERDVINRLLIFVGDLPLAGHNVSFDYEFLCRSCKRWGFPALPEPCLDSLKLARKKLRGLPHDLSHLAVYYEIENTGAHRALADCRMTYEVLMRLLDEPGGFDLDDELPDEGYDDPYLPPKGKNNALGAEFRSVMVASPADGLQLELEPVSEPADELVAEPVPERERSSADYAPPRHGGSGRSRQDNDAFHRHAGPGRSRSGANGAPRHGGSGRARRDDSASPRNAGPGSSEPNANAAPRSVNTGRSRKGDYDTANPADGGRDRATGNAVPRSRGTGRSHRDASPMTHSAGPDGSRGRVDVGAGQRGDERVGQPSGLGASGAEQVVQSDGQPQRAFIPVSGEKKPPVSEPKLEVKRDLDYFRRARKPDGGYAPRRDFIPCIGYETEQQAIPVPEPASERKPDSESPSIPVPMPNSRPAPMSGPRSAPMPNPRSAPMSDPRSVSMPNSRPAPMSDPRSLPMPNSRPAPMSDPRSAPMPNSRPAPMSNPRSASMPNPIPTPLPEPNPAPIPAPGSDQPQQEDRSNRVHDNFGSWWDG